MESTLPIDAFLHPVGFALFAGWWIATLYCVAVCQRHPNIPAEYRQRCNLLVLISGPWGLALLLLRYRYPAGQRAALEYRDHVEGGPMARRFRKAFGVPSGGVPEESSIEFHDTTGELISQAELSERGHAGQGLVQAKILLLDALEAGATQLELEPRHDGRFAVRLCLDGVLQDVQQLPSDLAQKVVNCLKIAARLNIAERRREQEGGLLVQLPDTTIQARLSTRGTLHGPQVALTLRDPRRRPRPAGALGMRPGDLQRLLALLKERGRMVLCCGPAGSGRTTTLYGLLTQFDPQATPVATIEEQIEYPLEHATQTEISAAHEISYSTVLRSMVRQEPEVILIGEIRDTDTAELALQAAESGQLILTSMESRDGAAALMRLRGMGIPTPRLADAVAAIVSQRLVRMLCSRCKQATQLKAAVWSVAQQHGLTSPRVHRAVGCPECHRTGYRGRTAMFELLTMAPGVAGCLGRDPSIQELREAAAGDGLRPLVSHGVELISAGVTTLEEVQSAISA